MCRAGPACPERPAAAGARSSTVPRGQIHPHQARPKTTVSPTVSNAAATTWTFSKGSGLRQESEVIAVVGGDTVLSSTYESCEFLPPPEKFEAGLQDYAGIMGMGAAAPELASHARRCGSEP